MSMSLCIIKLVREDVTFQTEESNDKPKQFYIRYKNFR